jgi:hypothetical protein
MYVLCKFLRKFSVSDVPPDQRGLPRTIVCQIIRTRMCQIISKTTAHFLALSTVLRMCGSPGKAGDARYTSSSAHSIRSSIMPWQRRLRDLCSEWGLILGRSREVREEDSIISAHTGERRIPEIFVALPNIPASASRRA